MRTRQTLKKIVKYFLMIYVIIQKLSEVTAWHMKLFLMIFKVHWIYYCI